MTEFEMYLDEVLDAYHEMMQEGEQATTIGLYEQLEERYNASRARLMDTLRWIPVTERLPEDEGRVLASVLESGYAAPDVEIASCNVQGNRKWHGTDGVEFPEVFYTVLAWLPLPEAYDPEATP